VLKLDFIGRKDRALHWSSNWLGRSSLNNLYVIWDVKLYGYLVTYLWFLRLAVDIVLHSIEVGLNLESYYSGATTAEKSAVVARLKSRGGPRFGSQHRGAPRLAKGRAGCWVPEGVAPSLCVGPGVSPPEIF